MQDPNVNIAGSVTRSPRGKASSVADVEVSISTSGDNIIVAVPSDQCLHLHGLVLTALSSVDITVKAGSTEKFILTDIKTVVLGEPSLGTPIFVGEAGEDLVLNLSSAVAVTGFAVYKML